MNVNLYVIEDYENKTAFRPKKTNPKQTQFRKAKMNLKSLAKKSGHNRSAEITKIGCVHISKKYNVLIRKFLDSQTNFVVKNGLY